MNLLIGVDNNRLVGISHDYDSWIEETSFDEFLDDVLQQDWNVYFNMVIQFHQPEKDVTVTDYILANANPEQLERYLEYIRSGIRKLYEKLPMLDIRVPTKSARN